MILVLADDLAGAAELAGAARNLGLSAELQAGFRGSTAADVLCVDTDTRSCSREEAACRAMETARHAMACGPAWTYKKSDSVLRGHVLAEIRAVMAAGGYSRCLLIPANPRAGRVIRDGRYFVGDRPLDETPFARDPEYPRRTAEVLQLLAAGTPPDSGPGESLRSLRPGEALPPDGILLPDAASPADLAARAAQVDAVTLPAGGAEFFQALLLAKGCPCPSLAGSGLAAHPAARPAAGPVVPRPATLFVCGSAAAWSGSRRRQCAYHAIPLLAMPAALFAARCDHAAMEDWCGSIRQALAASGRAMVAIGDAAEPAVRPPELARRLVTAVRRSMPDPPVCRLCVEGGATAVELLRALDWTRLAVCQPCAPGVGALRPLDAAGPVLFVKPGSYEWPEELW